MTTIAAIDCGTNSIRLLVLRENGDRLDELAREVRLARLGQGVDATGEFHPDALARSFAVVDEYATIMAGLGVERVRFVATSAARDVSNRELFFDGIRARLGVAVEVIPGQEEARLMTLGVMSGVGAAAPVLVVDIGGGSTELAVINDAHQLEGAVSLDVGAVRVTERFLATDPPTPEEQAAARAWVGGLLDGSGIEFARIETCVGVGGTVTSLAASVLGLTAYSRDAVHRTRLSREEICEQTAAWLDKTVASIETEPLMQPLRAGVIGGGSLILDEISSRVPGGSVLVSESDILDGIALEMLD
ncbi:MAG: exopolyphosphatase [Arachnia sp.]